MGVFTLFEEKVTFSLFHKGEELRLSSKFYNYLCTLNKKKKWFQ